MREFQDLRVTGLAEVGVSQEVFGSSLGQKGQASTP